jgi:hypothetical protein
VVNNPQNPPFAAPAVFPALPGHAQAWPDGVGNTALSPREAGAGSGAAAGLVPLKTSPHENKSDQDSLYVSFDADALNLAGINFGLSL